MESSDRIYAQYQCPLCGSHMRRDASVFLCHARGHILEALRKEHPEWGSPQDALDASQRYYESQFPH